MSAVAPVRYESPRILRRTVVGPELIGLAAAPSDPPTLLFSEN